MSFQNRSIKWGLIATFLGGAIVTSACDAQQVGSPMKNFPLPNVGDDPYKQIAMVVYISKDGSIAQILDAKDGEKAAECRLCQVNDPNEKCPKSAAKEHGVPKHQPKVNLSLPICGPLLNGAILNIRPIVIMQGIKNPDCTIVENDGSIRLVPRGCKH